MTTTKLKVDGVTCGHCTGAIQRELGELPGVSEVTATLEGEVTVVHDGGATDRSEIESLLREINYPPVDAPS